MKFQIMLGILFTLLNKRKVSATELAAKYDCSPRSIYRYVDEMTIAGIPIDVIRGANGGIYISDAFKLPKGFLSKEEYGRTIAALYAMYGQLEDATLLSAINKLSSQAKQEKCDLTLSGNILVDSGTWGDNTRFSEKLSLLERAIERHIAVEIDYVSREGKHTQRKILPHLLVLKQNLWYVYAYCTTRKAFRLFKLGRIRTLFETEETFEPIPFSREDVPLQFWHDGTESIFTTFSILPEALPFAEEWLGIENIVKQGENYFAEVTLPDDESLTGKILSMGAGMKVLSPESLKRRIKEIALRMAED